MHMLTCPQMQLKYPRISMYTHTKQLQKDKFECAHARVTHIHTQTHMRTYTFKHAQMHVHVRTFSFFLLVFFL